MHRFDTFPYLVIEYSIIIYYSHFPFHLKANIVLQLHLPKTLIVDE